MVTPTNYRVDSSFPSSKMVRISGDVKEEQYYTLAELQGGDEAGTTETDSKTNPASPGYSTINKKSY